MIQTKPEHHYEKYYDDLAEYWDWLYSAEESELSIFAYHFLRRREIVLKRISAHPIKGDASYLDAGCGPGAYSDALLNMGYEVYGFDQSSEMVKKAIGNVKSERKDHAHIDVGSLDNISFDDNSFDVLTNIAVLMYVSDPQKCISEMARVLKPGGLGVITVDSKIDFADRIDIPARIGRLIKRLKTSNNRPGDSVGKEDKIKPQCYSPKEMRAMYTKAGIKEVDYTSIGYTPIQLNGKRIFSDKTDISIDRVLSIMRRFPISKGWGYTYISFVTKPE